MQVVQLESKATAVLAPTKEERVQDVRKDEITEMSCDKHHWALFYITEETYMIVFRGPPQDWESRSWVELMGNVCYIPR